MLDAVHRKDRCIDYIAFSRRDAERETLLRDSVLPNDLSLMLLPVGPFVTTFSSHDK